MRKREKLEKKCLNCDKLIPSKHVYCSNKCQGDHIRKNMYNKIESGDTTLTRRAYKLYLIDKYGEKCMECGWKELNPTTNKIPIELEHVDGHSENNDLPNLKLLCPNCHSLTPTYKALNKGNGIQSRLQRYYNDKILTIKVPIEIKKYFCIVCGVELKSNVKTGKCQKCVHLDWRRAIWPSREELSILIKNNSILSISKKFGVSDSTIRKWCKRYDLPYRKEDIRNFTSSRGEIG